MARRRAKRVLPRLFGYTKGIRMVFRTITVAAGLGTSLALSACNIDQGSAAEKGCQAVTAELMRSPESLKVVSRFEHGSEVFMEVRADNAYGTEVRSSVLCQMGEEPGRVRAVTIDGEEINPYAVLAASVRVSNARQLKDLD